MEDFISVSEIEMMCAKGGYSDDKITYNVVPPYGVDPPWDYVVEPPYGVDQPSYTVLAPYGVNPPM